MINTHSKSIVLSIALLHVMFSGLQATPSIFEESKKGLTKLVKNPTVQAITAVGTVHSLYEKFVNRGTWQAPVGYTWAQAQQAAVDLAKDAVQAQSVAAKYGVRVGAFEVGVSVPTNGSWVNRFLGAKPTSDGFTVKNMGLAGITVVAYSAAKARLS